MSCKILKKNRIIAILLVIVMLAVSFPVRAYADDTAGAQGVPAAAEQEAGGVLTEEPSQDEHQLSGHAPRR